MSVTARVRGYGGNNFGMDAAEVQAHTLHEALREFAEHHSVSPLRFIDEQGELHRFVNVYVDEEDVRFGQKRDTPLKSGDEVLIIPVVIGG